MSLIYDPSEVTWCDLADCFYCGQSLTFPALHWAGMADPGNVFYHPTCAVELFCRLLVDVYVCERASGKRLVMS